MRAPLETLATVLIAIAALTVTVNAVRRDSPQQSIASAGVISTPIFDSTWQKYVPVGVSVGDSSAQTTVVVFSDFECPFCRKFHEQFMRVRAKDPGGVRLVFVHYPLTAHRLARPTARAAECADRAGRFLEFSTVAFAHQDSLGIIPWGSFAVEAGVPDTAKFVACARGSEPLSRVDAGVALGKQLQISGTPTVLINGWRYPVAPYESLESEIRSIQDAGRPASGAREVGATNRRKGAG